MEDKFDQTLQKILSETLKRSFTKSEGKIERITYPESKTIISEKLSLIILCNETTNMFLRIYYDQSTLQELVTSKNQENKKSLSKRMEDYTKELVNIIGGVVAHTLSKEELPLNISLPLSINGFDELFSHEFVSKKQHKLAYRIQLNNSHMVFALKASYQQLDDYEKVKRSSFESMDDHIDFL